MPVTEALRAVQETLDEHKENIPEGIYLQLMASLSDLYNEDDDRKFHPVHYVVVSPQSYRADAHMHCCICQEGVRGPPNSPQGWLEAMRSATITTEMIEYTPMPFIVRDRSTLYIFTGTSPLE